MNKHIAPPYAPPTDPLKTVYADAHIVVIDKPSGLLSVPGRGPEKADCAASRTQDIYPGALTVHRLDMDTSGLLILARNKDAHRAMSLEFEKGRVTKTYIAHVWGHPDPANGLIDFPIMLDWPNRPRQKVDPENGKPSQTRFEVSGQQPHGAILTLAPLTGRTHQLRVHLAAIGHSILGDDLYATQASLDASPRLCLHADRLSFKHPITQEPLSFASPCPF